MVGVEALSDMMSEITKNLGLFSLIDPEALYLWKESSRVLIFSHINCSSMSGSYPYETFLWPTILFEVLSTPNFCDPYEVIMTPDIFKELIILDLKDLPLYVSNRNSDKFTDLLKGYV